MIIGLTGGIASGKSTAVEIFRKKGAAIIDADKISREIIDNKAVSEQLKMNFPEVYENDTLNRKKLREIIINDVKRREVLNNITHPAILAEIKREMSMYRAWELVVVDVPLMFEVGFDKEFDTVIVISAELEKRIERIVNRDRCSRESAIGIINAQMPLEEKEALATFVIYNNEGLDKLEKDIDIILIKLLSERR